MIKHIVMWKLKQDNGVNAALENARKLKSDIEQLAQTIPEIKHIEVGLNIAGADTASDAVLYSEFETLADLDIYQNHPDHQKVVAFVKEIAAERRVVDYEHKGVA